MWYLLTQHLLCARHTDPGRHGRHVLTGETDSKQAKKKIQLVVSIVQRIKIGSDLGGHWVMGWSGRASQEVAFKLKMWVTWKNSGRIVQVWHVQRHWDWNKLASVDQGFSIRQDSAPGRHWQCLQRFLSQLGVCVCVCVCAHAHVCVCVCVWGCLLLASSESRPRCSSISYNAQHGLHSKEWPGPKC